MQGGGIDMYDLIPDLHETSDELYFTGQKFWVGVVEGLYPSPPVPRRRTKCYTAAPVYIYNGIKLFSMNKRDTNGEFCKDFYKIPDNELKFIQ